MSTTYKVMIGFSTGQNTANLMPLLAYANQSITHFLIISTIKMQRQTERLRQVLDERGVDVHVLSIYEELSSGSNSRRLAKHIRYWLQDFGLADSAVFWNIGGGQKVHTIALWELYRLRRRAKQLHDVVCYADMFTGKLYEYNPAGGWRVQNLRSDVRLDEVLTLSGFKSIGSPKPKFMQGRPESDQDTSRIPNLWPFIEFRTYLFRLAGNRHFVKEVPVLELKKRLPGLTQKLESIKSLKEMWKLNPTLKSLLIKLFGETDRDGLVYEKLIYKDLTQPVEMSDPRLLSELSILLKDTPMGSLKGYTYKADINPKLIKALFGEMGPGIYFERIVQQLLDGVLYQQPNHRVLRAYHNVEIIAEDETDPKKEAEYDVLWLTEWGTLIVFDAKTYKFERKDLHARQHILQKAAGTALSFYPVLPYFWEDLDTNYMSDTLKRLPFDLVDKTKHIFVVSDLLKSFWVTRDEEETQNDFATFNNYQAQTELTEDPFAVRCHPIQNCLIKLNLLNEF